METNKVNNIYKKLTEMLSKLENEKLEIEKLIEEDNSKVATAQGIMDTAMDNGDVNAYKKANEELETAKLVLTMHTDRLEKIKGKALITPLEYDEMCKEIIEEHAKNEKELEKFTLKVADQLYEKGEELSEYQELADKTLHLLQYDVYRCVDIPKTQNGVLMAFAQYVKRINNNGIAEWSKSLARHGKYKVLTGVDKWNVKSSKDKLNFF